MATVVISEKDICQFTMIQPGILGDKHTDMVAQSGKVSYEIARSIDPEVANLHTQFYPYFKETTGLVNDASAYSYYVFLDANKKRWVFGAPWIDETSLRVVQSATASIVIVNWQGYMEAPLRDRLGELGANYTLTINRA